MSQTDYSSHKNPDYMGSDELKRSQDRLLMATEAGRVGIWEWNIAENKLFWSDIVKDIYGLPRDQEPTMGAFQAAIHPDDKDLTRQHIAAALDPTHTQVYEVYHRIIVHGTIKWVQGFGKVFFDSLKLPVLMSGTVIDITERKNAEEKSIQLSAVGRSLSRAITSQDVAEVIKHFAMDILGADALTIYEKHAHSLRLIHSYGYDAESLAEFSSLKMDAKLPYVDAGFQGRFVFLQSKSELLQRYPALALCDKEAACGIPLVLNEKVLGVIGLTFKVPQVFMAEMQRFLQTFADQCAQAFERVRLYEEERRARLEAEAASRSKSRFLANVSHEIRTPLGAVLGFADLLKTPGISAAESSEYLETILRNGKLLGKVINDILDLSKIESDSLDIEEIDFELLPLIKDVIDLLSLQAREKNIELICTALEPLPKRIRSDPTRLRQILVNLISNALKFTKEGEIEVTVAARAGEPFLHFSVRDSGMGIDAEHAERIFEPFTQADSSTTRHFGGTGLGLAISRSLARALGGDLRLRHAVLGQGSCFDFSILVGIADAFEPSFPPAEVVSRSVDLSGIKVLVVDDGIDNLALISRFLQTAGAIVTKAFHGQEGVDLALSGNFDVVIMDIQMPEMDGFGALKMLQENSYSKAVLALTAHAMKTDRELSLKAGFKDHLVKPVDRFALLSAVEKAHLNGKA